MKSHILQATEQLTKSEINQTWFKITHLRSMKSYQGMFGPNLHEHLTKIVIRSS